MYDRILVPTDGSTGSEQVAGHAAALAATTDAALHALYVVDEKAVGVGAGAGDVATADIERAFEGTGQDALERVVDVAGGHDVETTTELRQGAPHREIVDYAAAVAADVIVMGTHGRSGIERYLLGSVTEHVIRAAPQPVLAVKLGGSAVDGEAAARRAAESALEADGTALAELRDEPYRERSTWVVPAVTAADRRVNVHVDAVTGDTRIARLDD